MRNSYILLCEKTNLLTQHEHSFEIMSKTEKKPIKKNKFSIIFLLIKIINVFINVSQLPHISSRSSHSPPLNQLNHSHKHEKKTFFFRFGRYNRNCQLKFKYFIDTI